MKKTSVSKSSKVESPEMLPECDFDYSKARPNRFVGVGDGKRRRINKLFAAADRLADLTAPLTEAEAEVEAEIAVTRKGKRAF